MSKRKGSSNRKIDTRNVKETFLIVCEGTKTEPNYFRDFRVAGKIMVIGRNPIRIVKKAEELQASNEYDQVSCVFDRDQWTPNDFNNAIKNAEDKGFKVAYSNEAFELWYILHFYFLDTATSRHDYCKKLDVLLGKQYSKNSDTMYDDLLKRQDEAIKNAKKLLEQYKPCTPSQDNPSTTIFLLVEELNKSKSS